jgi:hypothetical protein
VFSLILVVWGKEGEIGLGTMSGYLDFRRRGAAERLELEENERLVFMLRV